MALRLETRSRALALQLLYAWDEVGAGRPDPRAFFAAICAARGSRPQVETKALDLAEAVLRAQERYDVVLQRAAENWRLERLAVVDRNVLRLAMAELEQGEAPVRVVIDEAIRLARWFGSSRSPAFVNGILDRVARDGDRL